MCGLLGIAGEGIVKQDLQALYDLGTVSQLRGNDGAGVYQVNSRSSSKKNNSEYLYKTQDTFQELLMDSQYGKILKANNFLNSISNTLYMGHVRAATKGIICDDNAHPFLFPNLVGAHNGTLKDSKYHSDGKEDIRTDSEMMFEDISTRGIVEVLKGLDPKSAYAITMYDRVTRKLYIIRNQYRPLFIAHNNTRRVMYWASEKDFLKLVLNRIGIDCTIHRPKENVLYVIDPHDVGNGSTPKFRIAWDNNPPEEEKKTIIVNDAPFEPTNNVVSINRAVVSVPEVKKQTSPVTNPAEAPSFESFHSSCKCGKYFNVMETWLARRHRLAGVSYNETTKEITCDGCAKKEAVNGYH